jgi:RNA polymerase sigma-70 factor (ECF subfamily)
MHREREENLESEDRRWIEPYVREFSRPAFELAMMLTVDRETAHDIVQEAFVRLWQSPRTPRDAQGFRAWLYRTVTNLARDHHRKTTRWARLRLPGASSADPLEEVEQRWSSGRLWQALASLSYREREAIILRYFGDVPYEAIASRLALRSGAARVVVHRALEKLRRRLTTDGLGEAL